MEPWTGGHNQPIPIILLEEQMNEGDCWKTGALKKKNFEG
jgi:hypothetical protein